MENKIEPLQGRITLPFKLKNRMGKDRISFRLKELFGFLPEVIVFICVPGDEHRYQLFAEFTSEEQAKEILKQKEKLSKEGETKAKTTS